MIVDSHQHVWDPTRLTYPWLADNPELNHPLLPADAQTDGVDRVIFVEADAADGDAEARWVQRLAPEWPQLAGIVAFAAVESAGLPFDLDRLGDLALFRGVRRLLQDEPAEVISSAALQRGLRELATRGIPFDACVRHHQLSDLRRTLEHAPDCTVVIDHLGKPPVRLGLDSRAGETWIASMEALAEIPSVVVKLSGLAPEADPALPLAGQVKPFLDVALRVFGPARCMVGSDWPVSAVTPHRLTNAEWFDLVGSRIADPTGRQQVLSGTAERIYVVAAARPAEA